MVLGDILWRNDNGVVGEWDGQFSGGFVGDANANIQMDSSWHVVGTGDFNGDGIDDILWRNDNGIVGEWDGQSDGSFVGDGNANIPVGNDRQIAGTGDFNGDGRADILWRGTDGTITDWLGQANGGFVDNSAAASQFVNNQLQVAGVGDFNGDGKSDVLWQASDGTLQTWVACKRRDPVAGREAVGGHDRQCAGVRRPDRSGDRVRIIGRRRRRRPRYGRLARRFPCHVRTVFSEHGRCVVGRIFTC